MIVQREYKYDLHEHNTLLSRIECMRYESGTAWCVRQSVSLGTRLRPAKTAEWIEVLFRVETAGDPRNIESYFLYEFDAAFAKLLWPFVVVYEP